MKLTILPTALTNLRPAERARFMRGLGEHQHQAGTTFAGKGKRNSKQRKPPKMVEAAALALKTARTDPPTSPAVREFCRRQLLQAADLLSDQDKAESKSGQAQASAALDALLSAPGNVSPTTDDRNAASGFASQPDSGENAEGIPDQPQNRSALSELLAVPCVKRDPWTV